MRRIATYGTLKRGFYNNYLLGPDAKFVGEGTFPGTIWCEKGQGYPRAVVDTNDIMDDIVHVEVYDIDDLHFDMIDRLERAFAYEAVELFITMTNGSRLPCLCWLSTEPASPNATILEDGVYA